MVYKFRRRGAPEPKKPEPPVVPYPENAGAMSLAEWFKLNGVPEPVGVAVRENGEWIWYPADKYGNRWRIWRFLTHCPEHKGVRAIEQPIRHAGDHPAPHLGGGAG